MSVTIKRFEDSYFLCVNNYAQDWQIIKILDIDFEDYKNILVNKFNGYTYDNKSVYFNDIHDVHKAAEWVESVLIAKKLVGVIQ